MFRFSIRELILVTLVVGMGIGWWMDRRVAANRLANRIEESKRLKDVLFDAKAAVEELLVPKEEIKGSSLIFMPDFDSVLGSEDQRCEFKPRDRH